MAKHKKSSWREAPSSHARTNRAGVAARLGGALTLALLVAACSGGAGSTPAVAHTAQGSAATDRSVTTTPSSGAPTQAATRAGATGTPLPAIVVAQPVTGQTVHSPFHVSGTADTFEAIFRVQLTDRAGKVLLDQQVQATSGSGTRGSFDTTLSTPVRGPAILVVYERSAKDGSPVNTVSLQLTLA
jgi:Immunoglobulin-like domain of bacterial spore germination